MNKMIDLKLHAICVEYLVHFVPIYIGMYNLTFAHHLPFVTLF